MDDLCEREPNNPIFHYTNLILKSMQKSVQLDDLALTALKSEKDKNKLLIIKELEEYVRIEALISRIYKSWTEFHKLGVAKSKVMQEENVSDVSTLFGYVNKNKVKLFEAWKQRYIGEILFKHNESYHSISMDWVQKAIASDERDGMKWYLARDLALLGGLYKKGGNIKKYKEYLCEAVSTFNECGADGWVNKYEKELAAFS